MGDTRRIQTVRIKFTEIYEPRKMNELMDHISRMTSEFQRVTSLLSGGVAGAVLTKDSGDDYAGGWASYLGAGAAVDVDATTGFLYIPTCAGPPTGTPEDFPGLSPLVIDSVNNKLYFYTNGVWRDAGP